MTNTPITNNPLLTRSTLPYQMPNWSEIKPAHIIPAFQAAMQAQREVWEEIATNPDAPSVANTVEALENAGRTLNEVSNIAFTLFSSIGGAELDAIQSEIGPQVSQHFTRYYLDQRIYHRLEELLQTEGQNLDSETYQYLTEEIATFKRSGINLNDTQKAQLTELDAQLAQLQIEFNQRAIQGMTDAELVVTDSQLLAGLSPQQLAKYKQADGSFRLPIENYSQPSLLAELSNSATRAQLLANSLQRGLDGNPLSDTQELVLNLAKLRAKRAELLGYPHHAAAVADASMAKSSAAVIDLLSTVAQKAIKAAQSQFPALLEAAESDGITEFLPSDWVYYQEQLRSQLGVNDATLAPYFELNNVMERGVLYAATQLFGITFHARTDLPTYLPSVKTWEVQDENGKVIAIFQADFYRRPGKYGGAWMHSIVEGCQLDGTIPVIMNNCNYPEPADGQPCLLNWDQVVTLFHEFGHALHGMLSQTRYRSLGGTSVPRDFVETPSQMNEMWATHPQVLANYAIHYETGLPLSAQQVERVIQAANFSAAFDTTEQLKSALLDQGWHHITSDTEISCVESYEQEILRHYQVEYPLIPPRYRSGYFSHTFGSSYDAAYYAYTWAEVLAADIENWYRTTGAKDNDGGLNRTAGTRVREEILSRGNSRPPMESFQALLGRPPRPEAVLERRGLA